MKTVFLTFVFKWLWLFFFFLYKISFSVCLPDFSLPWNFSILTTISQISKNSVQYRTDYNHLKTAVIPILPSHLLFYCCYAKPYNYFFCERPVENSLVVQALGLDSFTARSTSCSVVINWQRSTNQQIFGVIKN